MQLLRSAISSILVGLTLSSLIFPTYATAADTQVIESQTMNSAVQTVEDSSDPTNGAEIVELDDLNVQLNDLYYEIGEQLNIDYMYVKILHMLAGGKRFMPMPLLTSELMKQWPVYQVLLKSLGQTRLGS